MSATKTAIVNTDANKPAISLSDTPSDADRRERYIANLFNPIFRTPKEAALGAGYSECYAEKAHLYLAKSGKLPDLIRQYATAHDILDLPKIYALEKAALNQAIAESISRPDSTIDNLSKLRHLIKTKKQIAGVLQQDTEQAAPTINIGEVRQLMIQIHGGNGNEHA